MALTEGLLLPTLANNVPMALALEILLRLDGPAQLRQSFESRGVLGQELVPCLLGPAPGGPRRFPVVGSAGPKERSYGSPTACHASRLVEALAGFPHLAPGFAPGPPAERLMLRHLRCLLVVESGVAKGLGGVARRCVPAQWPVPWRKSRRSCSATNKRRLASASSAEQSGGIDRASCARSWCNSASDLAASWSIAQASRRSWPQAQARR